jgi:hypothetical protein
LTVRSAWAAFKPHWRVFVLAELIIFAAWVCLEVSVIATHRLGVAINLLLHLAFLVFWAGLMAGCHALALQTVDGAVPTIHSLRPLLPRGLSYLCASVLYGVAVVAGLALLVVPGIYIAVRYSLFGYVIASGESSPLRAWRTANSLSDGCWWALFRVLIVLLLVNLAGLALLGVGVFVTFPVVLIAGAGVFRSLEKARQPA